MLKFAHRPTIMGHKWKAAFYLDSLQQATPPEPVALALFHQQLQNRARSSRILIKPRRNGYYCGEIVEAQVHDLDARFLGTERFCIETSPGGGFAGQVYKATPQRGIIQTKPVAIKALVPRSRWKVAFRDLLFRLSFQTSFAPRLREDALRSGLIWQAILRIAASIELGSDSAIAKPLGYYWDDELGSYAEIHEWVESRDVKYQADDQMFLRWLGRAHEWPDSEMKRKKQFMDELVKLCYAIGAVGLARQFEWYTFVSQANVLTRSDTQEFVAVDCRPGLAVPFFLPLSPVHARIILLGLKRGMFAHFDQVDFGRLNAYVSAHAQAFQCADGLIEQLKKCDTLYRARLPNLWHVRTRLLRDGTFRQGVKEAAIQDWHKSGQVSDQEAERLAESKRYWLDLILDNAPILGHWLLCIAGNERYRQHLRNACAHLDYLRETIEAHRACDLLAWEGGRITTERAMTLAVSIPDYLIDKLAWSWLPQAIHRLATDAKTRQQFIYSLIVQPARLCLNRTYRQDWLTRLIGQQLDKGMITSQQAEQLCKQVGEPRMQNFLRDLGLTIGLEVMAKMLYVVLAAYGASTGNLLPLAIAALGPIPPSGVVRTVYVLAQLACDLPHIIRHQDRKLLFTRLLGLVSAPWRAIGNLFAPLEMFAYYNDMSLLLGDYLASKMVDAVPVLGGRGKLLEHWTFNLVYNFPLSVRRTIWD